MGKKLNSEERKQQAARIRQIRENSKLTQEQFAEILDISVSAYKKVECGENQISLACLRKLYDEMKVSSDFVLYNKRWNIDEIWSDILNCSEADKMFIFARLMTYFTESKAMVFPQKQEQEKYDEEILQLIKSLQINGENKCC